MAVSVVTPMKCMYCGSEIKNHFLNNNNGRLVFPCPKCKRNTEMTESEYRKQILRNACKK